MSCCGNKRKEWLQEIKSTRASEVIAPVPEANPANKPDRIFEYTGDFALVINGVATGNTYYFKHKGDKINVDYYDSFAMMAERDLKISGSAVE